MKKLTLCAALMAALAMPVLAEQHAEVDGQPVVFAPYSTLQLQGGAGYTIGEVDCEDLWSPAAAFSWQGHFTPWFSLRAGASGWQAKGGFTLPDYQTYKFNYVDFNLDLMFNVSNIIAGWNPNRRVDIYAFVGALGGVAFNNKDVRALYNTQRYDLDYFWKQSQYLYGGRGGLLVDVRLNNNWGINLECNANGVTDRFNSKKGSKVDWTLNTLLGVSYHFGKGYKPARRCCASTQPVIVDKPQEVVVVHDTVYVTREPETKTIVLTAEDKSLDLFFDLCKSEITPEADAKLQKLAAWCKQNKAGKIQVTGFADRGTGNPRINKELSEQRAASAATALVEKYGISRDQLVVSSYGDTVQPFEENDLNRLVHIEVK